MWCWLSVIHALEWRGVLVAASSVVVDIEAGTDVVVAVVNASVFDDVPSSGLLCLRFFFYFPLRICHSCWFNFDLIFPW